MPCTKLHLVVYILIAFGLGGCIAAPEAPTSTPDREDLSLLPTAPPPSWQEPFTPITLDNVDQVVFTGRLDAPVTDAGSIFAHAFSIDGTRLAGLNNEQLIVWDVVNGETVFSAARQGALDVFFSPDKTELYIIDAEGNVSVLEGDTGFVQNVFLSHPDFVGGEFTYDPENGILAVVSIQGDIRLWDALERRAIVNLTTRNPEINSITFSPDGALIALGDDTGNTAVWDWQADEEIAAFPSDEGLSVDRLAFSPDNRQLAVATDEDIRVWDIDAQEIEFVLLTGQGGSSDILKYTPDGGYLINSGIAEAMNVWDTTTGDLVAALPELGGEPTAAVFSPEGSLMLTSVFQGGTYIWDVASISEEGIGRAQLDVEANIIDVAWSPDGRTLALFDASGSVLIWGIPDDTPPPSVTEDPTG